MEKDKNIALIHKLFDGSSEIAMNANEAIDVISATGDKMQRRFTEQLIPQYIEVLRTINSYSISGVVLALKNWVKSEMVSVQECVEIAGLLQKYDSITHLDMLDTDDIIMRKLWMRENIFELAKVIYDQFPNLRELEEIKMWEQKAISGDEFADVCVYWG